MTGPFRLAGLLRLRRLQEEQAAADLARANAALRATQREQREVSDRLAASAFPIHSHDTDWRAAAAGRAALTSLVGEASVAVEVSGRRATFATADWSATRTLATTLEKLEERHNALVRAEDERLEQLLLDEAALRRNRANHDLTEEGS